MDRILVVGAGSTGGYFGAHLAKAGRDVTFLVRPRRKQQIERGGLVINGRGGTFTVQPKMVQVGEAEEFFDVVIVAVKGQSLPGVIVEIAPYVGPDTLILPLLNGMRHYDLLEHAFGKERLLGCVCKIGAVVRADGSIDQLSDQHELAYGELDGTRSGRLDKLHARIVDAGFTARVSANIVSEIWMKWCMIATIGAVTCTMRAPVGAVASTPEGSLFSQAVLREVCAVVSAIGTALPSSFVDDLAARLGDTRSAQVSSLYRDLIENIPTEYETVIGDLCDRALAAGIATPLLGAARAHLATYEHILATRSTGSQQ